MTLTLELPNVFPAHQIDLLNIQSPPGVCVVDNENRDDKEVLQQAAEINSTNDKQDKYGAAPPTCWRDPELQMNICRFKFQFMAVHTLKGGSEGNHE